MTKPVITCAPVRLTAIAVALITFAITPPALEAAAPSPDAPRLRGQGRPHPSAEASTLERGPVRRHTPILEPANLAPAAPILEARLDPSAETPAPPTGVRLPSGAHPVRYAIELTLSPESETFTGLADIEIEITTALPVLWLNSSHLTVGDAALTIGGEVLRPRIVPGGANFVGFAFDRMVGPGRAKLHVAYTGMARAKESSGLFRQLEGGDWYLYSQFESIEARWAFPCFDEPAFKVPWQFDLRVRKDLVAVSNTPVVSESEAPGGMKLVRFAETKPLPSYLLAFGVGPFDLVEGPPLGSRKVPFRVIVPKGQKGAGTDYAVKVTPEIVGLLEKYFGSPYPFEKLDLLAIPLFGGAMENAGLITYGRGLLLAKREEETLARQRSFAGIHAHELAHMWFGDLVTLQWWDDTWLNESFADWMSDKIVEQWHPEWGVDVQRVRDRARAMTTDSLITARRIRQPIESENDIENAFDSITYAKGASVLGMFERWIGMDRFQKGVQRYLERHAFGNSTADDFLSALAAESGARSLAPAPDTLDTPQRNKLMAPASSHPAGSGAPSGSNGPSGSSDPSDRLRVAADPATDERSQLVAAFKSFLDQGGVPLVTARLSCSPDGGRPPSIELSQKRYLPSGSKGSTDEVWSIPVCVRYEAGAATNVHTGRYQDRKLDRTPAAEGKRLEKGSHGNSNGRDGDSDGHAGAVNGHAGARLDRDGSSASGEECVLLTQPEGEITLEKAGVCPDWFLPNASAAGYYRSKIESENTSRAHSTSAIVSRLFEDGGRRMTVPERIGTFDDLRALALAGQTPIGDVLALIPELLRSDNRYTWQATTRLVESMRSHLVPDELVPNYQRFIKATFGAKARELGLVPLKGESDEVRLLRPGLISLVAVGGEDRRLQEQARKLAVRWLDDPRAIEPDMVDVVLEAAARHGDAALFERFRTAVRNSTDRSMRRHLLGAMAAFQDPALVNKRLRLLLSEELDIRESLTLLWGSPGRGGGPNPLNERGPREITYRFVKNNYDAIAGRLPDRSEASLVRAGSEFCDEPNRADVEAFFKERAAKALGGPRLLAETLESIDLCIATGKIQQESVASFLRKY